MEILLPIIMALIGQMASGGVAYLSQNQINKQNVDLQNLANQQNIDLQNLANRQNINLQQMTNEQNYRMWQQQVEYNQPQNQVNRLRQAGINPITAFGGIQNTMPNPPQMQAADTKAADIKAPQITNAAIQQLIAGMQSQFSQVGQNIAQNKLIQKQIEEKDISNELNRKLIPTLLAKNIQELENMGITSSKLKNEVKLLTEQIIEKELQNQFTIETWSQNLQKIANEVDNGKIQNEILEIAKRTNEYNLTYQKAIGQKNIQLAEETYKKLQQEVITLENMNKRELDRWMNENEQASLDKLLKSIQVELNTMELELYQSFEDETGASPNLLKTLQTLKLLFK